MTGKAPVPAHDIELLYVGSFDPSGTNNSTCEVVAYDADTKRLFSSSAISGFLDIIDFSNPTSLSLIKSVDINPYGGITSVAVNNGILAIASPNVNEELDGSILFFDTDGNFKTQMTVGALPDMITFTPDGKKLLSANEGQPTANYSIDPEGSVSIVDVTAGIDNITQADVKTLYFTDFNPVEAQLIAAGVRKLYAASTLSQDFEPEYITVDETSTKAWVTLQENNAIAEIDLQTGSIVDVWALGTKDVNKPGNGFDISDNNNEILIANWPINAYFIPDAVANYSAGGKNYIVTANEGDEKEYSGFEERTTIGAGSYVLDPVRFPQAAMLKKSYNAGRMRVTNLHGDTDKDGDFDEIYCVGSRSFTIWDADTKSMVYDSGDDFELYTSMTPSIAPLFNSDHESNSLKNRSRSKGPEPEGVTVAELTHKKYAFIALERLGGVMVYDVTKPDSVKFVDYKNSRTVSAYGGDNGAETLMFIDKKDSPDNKHYIVVANEISGTLAVYEVKDNNIDTDTQNPVSVPTFNIFPNPTDKSIVFFNRMADIVVVDVMGRIVFEAKNQLTLDVSQFVPGMYFVHTHDGATKRLVVR